MILRGNSPLVLDTMYLTKITALELETRNMLDMDIIDKTRSQRILNLVIDLKGTAQAFQELLKKKEHIEPINVNDLIKRTLQLIYSTARKENTRIVLNLPSISTLIMGNAIFLQQTSLNIILNAIQQMVQKAERYDWDGKRTLEISSSLKNDKWLQIRFKDNGRGIYKEHLGKLFTPGISTSGGQWTWIIHSFMFHSSIGW